MTHADRHSPCGSVTVIYSVVHNVVVDPLPYRDAGRLVNVLVKDSQSPRVRGTFTAARASCSSRSACSA